MQAKIKTSLDYGSPVAPQPGSGVAGGAGLRGYLCAMRCRGVVFVMVRWRLLALMRPRCRQSLSARVTVARDAPMRLAIPLGTAGS
jgi:hypothetical protein